MKIALSIILILFFTLSCKVSSVKLAASDDIIQALNSQDSIYVWTSQWLGTYSYENNRMTTGSTIYGSAIYFTEDSIFKFSMIDGFLGSSPYKLSKGILNVDDGYSKKVILEDSLLYFLYNGAEPSITFDSLNHDMIESFLRRKVPASEVLHFLTNQDSSYFRQTFLGIKTDSWCRMTTEPRIPPSRK